MTASCLAAEVRPAVPCSFIVPTHPGFALSVLLACVWGVGKGESPTREEAENTVDRKR